MFQDLYWKGQLLIFTWHFKKELEAIGKFEEYVLKILEKGEHRLISKKQQKYNVLYIYKKKRICLSYAKHESKIILIHIKPVK